MEDVVEKVERQTKEESWPAEPQHDLHCGDGQREVSPADVLQDQPGPQVHRGGDGQTEQKHDPEGVHWRNLGYFNGLSNCKRNCGESDWLTKATTKIKFE